MNEHLSAAKNLEGLITPGEAPKNMTMSAGKLLKTKKRIQDLKELGASQEASMQPTVATKNDDVKSHLAPGKTTTESEPSKPDAPKIELTGAEEIHAEYSAAFPLLFSRLPNYIAVEIIDSVVVFSDKFKSFLKGYGIDFNPDTGELEDEDVGIAILYEYQAVEAFLEMHVKRHGYNIPRCAVLEGCVALLSKLGIDVKDSEAFIHRAKLNSLKHATCEVLLEKKEPSDIKSIPCVGYGWHYSDFVENTHAIKQTYHGHRKEMEFSDSIHISKVEDASELPTLGNKFQRFLGMRKPVHKAYIDQSTPYPHSLNCPAVIYEDDCESYAPYGLLAGMSARKIELQMNNIISLPDLKSDPELTLTLTGKIDFDHVANIRNLDALACLNMGAGFAEFMPLNFKLPKHVKLILPLNIFDTERLPENVFEISAPSGESIPCLMVNNIPSCILDGQIVPLARVLQRFKAETNNHPVIEDISRVRNLLISLTEKKGVNYDCAL